MKRYIVSKFQRFSLLCINLSKFDLKQIISFYKKKKSITVVLLFSVRFLQNSARKVFYTQKYEKKKRIIINR